MLVVQLKTKVLRFDLVKGKTVQSALDETKDSFMAPLKLVCGPVDSCFYVQRSVKQGDEIISLGFETSSQKFVETSVFTHSDTILAI